jgi:hypothetical protein
MHKNSVYLNVLPSIYSQNYWVFGLFPSSGILERRKHDLLETICFYSHLRTETDPFFGNVVSKNPIILCVTHHFQNPLESTFIYCFVISKTVGHAVA